MSTISIDNGYQGDIESLIERIRLVCLNPKMYDIFKRSVENAEILLKNELPELRRLQACFDHIDESADECIIQPLNTPAIIINPKDEPRFYRQIRKLVGNPVKLNRVLNWLEAFADFDEPEIASV